MRLIATTTRFKTMLLVIMAMLMISAVTAIVVLDARERVLTFRGAEASSALRLAMVGLNADVDAVARGELTLEQAQARALKGLSEISFDGGLGYIAIQNDAHVNILHPDPDVQGKDLSLFRDSDGRFVSQEAIEIGRQGGIGWNTYKFVHPVTGQEDVKTSAIMRFDPWGWTLIAGVYDRELKTLIAEMIRQAAISGGVMLVLFSIIAFVLARTMTGPLDAVSAATGRVADGHLLTGIPYQDLPNEVGRIANAVEGFRLNALKITELNTKLERSLDKEREFACQQRRFVAMVSHEFRTPVAIIQGNCHLMKRRLNRMEPDQVFDKIAKISRAGDRMIKLLETVVYSAKVDEGKMSCDMEVFDLRQLLADVAEEMSDAEVTHRVIYDQGDLPEEFVGDETLLRQVFINLISNAVKFSPDADRVDVSAEDIGEAVRIDVTDHGIGIPEHELNQLFTRFFRASNATGIPGTGIGLNLVDTLVEAHGGHVDVRSTVGTGSTFSVVLPKAGTKAGEAVADKAGPEGTDPAGNSARPYDRRTDTAA